MSSMIAEIANYGLPIIIGTDKKNIPSFVQAVATKMGAKVISPNEDLGVDEKKVIIKERSKQNIAANDHESDALACALFAYKKIRSLISKIKNHLAEIQHENLLEDVFKLIISNDGLPIKIAVDILLQPNDEDVQIVSQAIQQKKLSQTEIRLYEKIKSLEKENSILQSHNEKIKHSAEQQKKDYNFMLKKIQQQITDKKKEILLGQKEKTIVAKQQQIQAKEIKVEHLQQRINQLLQLLQHADDYIIVKKLKNISTDYDQKKQWIKEKDVLFVEDSSIYSEQNLKEISNKTKIIITNNPNKIMKDYFIIFSTDDFKLIDLQAYYLIPKKQLNEKLDKQQLLTKVIEDYQRRDL